MYTGLRTAAPAGPFLLAPAAVKDAAAEKLVAHGKEHCVPVSSSSQCSYGFQCLDDHSQASTAHEDSGPLELPNDAVSRFPCGLIEDVSLDSFASEQDILACDELLFSDHQAMCSSRAAHPRHSHAALTSLPPSDLVKPEVADTIRNEFRRQAEVSHSGTDASSHGMWRSGITPDLRAMAVSWLVEVVAEFRLQQETLFLAISYVDRFLSLSQAVPKGMLQLVAVACTSLAAKQEEVEQPSAAHWVDIADNCFKREDLLRMEWLVIDTLGWRGRTPTAYSFLHLYCYGLGNCSSLTICVASYILELALLDGSLQSFAFSTQAAAALILAHAVTQIPFDVQALLALAPSLDMAAVHACSKWLTDLHWSAFIPNNTELSAGVFPIRQKYSRLEWCEAAYMSPVGQPPKGVAW